MASLKAFHGVHQGSRFGNLYATAPNVCGTKWIHQRACSRTAAHFGTLLSVEFVQSSSDFTWLLYHTDEPKSMPESTFLSSVSACVDAKERETRAPYVRRFHSLELEENLYLWNVWNIQTQRPIFAAEAHIPHRQMSLGFCPRHSLRRTRSTFDLSTFCPNWTILRSLICNTTIMYYYILLELVCSALTSSASNTLIGLLFIAATMPTTRLSIFYLSPLATYSSFAILKSFAASASTFVLCRYESLELQGTMTNFRSLLVSALHPLFTTFFIGRGVMMHFLLALVILFEHKSQLATECKFL